MKNTTIKKFDHSKKHISDIDFVEYKELSAFDHIKFAFKKTKPKDAIAYALITLFSTWILFCWVNFTNTYYSWNSPEGPWGRELFGLMTITRGASGTLFVMISCWYLLDWFLSEKPE